MISVDQERVSTLSYTCHLPSFPFRPFLLVLFILYQRDKPWKRVMGPARSSVPVSCTISRPWRALSCSNTQPSSLQVLPGPGQPGLAPFPSCAFLLIPSGLGMLGWRVLVGLARVRKGSNPAPPPGLSCLDRLPCLVELATDWRVLKPNSSESLFRAAWCLVLPTSPVKWFMEIRPFFSSCVPTEICP